VWRDLFRGRAAWLACILLLTGLQSARQFYAASEETPTWDEGLHIGTSLTFLRAGELRLDLEHPPLGRILNGLPLVLLGADPRLNEESWQKAQMVEHGQAVIYKQQGISAETVVLAARSATILLTAIMALAIAFWTRANFGPAAGLLAVFLFTLDPNISAHGRLVTTDFIGTFTFFLATIAFGRFLKTQKPLDLVWAGLALGAALSSKFSSVLLIPAFAILSAWHWYKTRQSIPRLFLQAAGIAAIALTVVFTLYGPETTRVIGDVAAGRSVPLQRVVHTGNPMSDFMAFAGRRLGVPSHVYFTGLDHVAEHNRYGHDSYILGKTRTGRGVWYYFPFVFLVKTPLGALLLIALCLPLIFRAREPGMILLAVPLLVYWASCLTSGINIGVRHLLPVYPLTYILAAALWTLYAKTLYRRAAPILLAGCCTLVVYESARIFPYDLAFFNTAAGGPANGPNLLVDSNLDWGQDVLRMKRWLVQRNAVNDFCICFFGKVDFRYYGLPDKYLPTTEDVRAGMRPECRYAAISATPLMGVYVPKDRYSWVTSRPPIARVGWSIYLYDISDRAGAGIR